MGNGAGTTVGSGPLIAGGIAPAKGKRPEENSQKAKLLQNNSLDGNGHGRAATPKVRLNNKCGEPYDDFSTGRTQPNNVKEKLAMDSVKSNPHDGKVIMTKLRDPRLRPGTVKYAKNFKFFDGSAEIHYLYHKSRGFFDFKFKD